jgi:hypothetical protein
MATHTVIKLEDDVGGTKNDVGGATSGVGGAKNDVGGVEGRPLTDETFSAMAIANLATSKRASANTSVKDGVSAMNNCGRNTRATSDSETVKNSMSATTVAEEQHGANDGVEGAENSVTGAKDDVGGAKNDVGGAENDVGGVKDGVGGAMASDSGSDFVSLLIHQDLFNQLLTIANKVSLTAPEDVIRLLIDR